MTKNEREALADSLRQQLRKDSEWSKGQPPEAKRRAAEGGGSE